MAIYQPPRRRPPAHLLGSGLIPQNYEDRAARLRADYTSSMGALSGEQSSLFRDYGFKGTIDSSGHTNYSVDPSAHFGQYQTWLRGLAESLHGARADAVSRGLGGRGLSMARSNLARFAGNQAQAEMLNRFTNSATGIYNRKNEALSTRDQGILGLEGEALDWWGENAPEDTGSVGGAGSPTQSGRTWQGRRPRGRYYE